MNPKSLLEAKIKICILEKKNIKANFEPKIDDERILLLNSSLHVKNLNFNYHYLNLIS